MNSMLPIPDDQQGKQVELITVSGKKILTQFALVELSQIIESNFLNGEINDFYYQILQPRDRTTSKSVKQVTNHSRNLNFDNLSGSKSTADGAPILGIDNQVESGNGRIMAIKKAYAEHNIEQYRQDLAANAPLYGFNRNLVECMRQPVLIRYRLTEVDREDFVKDCNHDNRTITMFESVSVDDISRHIQQAQSANDLKTLIISCYMGADTHDSDKNKVENFKQELLDFIKPVADKKHIQELAKRISIGFKAAQNYGFLGAYDGWKTDFAKALFENDNANQQWIDAFLNEPFMMGAVQRQYEYWAGNDYALASLAADMFKGQKELMHKYVSKAFFEWLIGKTLSINEWKAIFSGTVLDMSRFSHAPFTDFISKYTAIVDDLLKPSKSKAPVITEDDRYQILSPINFPAGGPYEKYNNEPVPTKVLMKVTEIMEVNASRRIATAKERISLKDTPENREYLKDAEARLVKFNNRTDEDKAELKKKIDLATTKYLKTGEIPDITDVGISLYNYISDFELEKNAPQTAKKIKKWVNGLVTQNKHVRQIPIRHSSANSGLRKMQISQTTFDKNIKDCFKVFNGRLKEPVFYCDPKRPRAHSADGKDGTKYINIGLQDNKETIKKTMWHEMGHDLEGQFPELRRAAIAFLNKRYVEAKEPKVLSLYKLENANFDPDEFSVNKYISTYYESKFYTRDKPFDEVKHTVSTELISTGMELLANPKKMALLAKDKDYLSLMVSAIAMLQDDDEVVDDVFID